MNNIKATAVVLLLLGGAALIGGSLASEAIQSDRGALFTVSEEDTIVATAGTDEVVIPGRGAPVLAEIATITNNFDEDMIIEFSLDLHGDSVVLEPPDQDTGALSLAPGESKDITARCATPGEGGDMGSGTTDLVITIHVAQGDTIGVEGMTSTIPVEYDCVGHPPFDDSDDSPGPPGDGPPGQPGN